MPDCRLYPQSTIHYTLRHTLHLYVFMYKIYIEMSDERQLHGTLSKCPTCIQNTSTYRIVEAVFVLHKRLLPRFFFLFLFVSVCVCIHRSSCECVHIHFDSVQTRNVGTHRKNAYTQTFAHCLQSKL